MRFDKNNNSDNKSKSLSKELSDKAEKVAKKKDISNSNLILLIISIRKDSLHHKGKPELNYEEAYTFAKACAIRVQDHLLLNPIIDPMMNIHGAPRKHLPKYISLAIYPFEGMSSRVKDMSTLDCQKMWVKLDCPLFYVEYYPRTTKHRHFKRMTFEDVAFVIKFFLTDVFHDQHYINFFHVNALAGTSDSNTTTLSETLNNTAKRVSKKRGINNAELLNEIIKLKKEAYKHKHTPDIDFEYIYVCVKAISIRAKNKNFVDVLSMPSIHLNGELDKGFPTNKDITINPLELLQFDNIPDKHIKTMLPKFSKGAGFYVSGGAYDIRPLTFDDVTLTADHLLHEIFNNNFCINFFHIKDTILSDRSDSDSGMQSKT